MSTIPASGKAVSGSTVPSSESPPTVPSIAAEISRGSRMGETDGSSLSAGLALPVLGIAGADDGASPPPGYIEGELNCAAQAGDLDKAAALLDEDARARLGEVHAALAGQNDWTIEALEATTKSLAERLELGLGKLAHEPRELGGTAPERPGVSDPPAATAGHTGATGGGPE